MSDLTEAIKLKEAVKKDTEDAITKSLFGKSRAEFISEAVNVAGGDWQFGKRGDIFEDALDWLNGEALEAYNIALGSVALHLKKNPKDIFHLPMIIKSAKPILVDICKPPQYIWERKNG